MHWLKIVLVSGLLFTAPTGVGGVGRALANPEAARSELQEAIEGGARSGTRVIIDHPEEIRGGLTTDSGLSMEWRADGSLLQVGRSETGSFLTNVQRAAGPEVNSQSDIELQSPAIDGAGILRPFELVVLRATASETTFTDDAPSADDVLRGLLLERTQAGQGGLVMVTSYDGETRTARHNEWVRPPERNEMVRAGWNENGIGFAGGVSRVEIVDALVANYPQRWMVPSGMGGKGLNLEQGVEAATVEGFRAVDVGTAVFVQGLRGKGAKAGERHARNINISGVVAEHVGSVITVAGVDPHNVPDGDPSIMSVTVDGVRGENVGHSPWRLCYGDRQKSGIINILEGQNAFIRNVATRNPSIYPESDPGYPDDLEARCGYGLSGPVGALIWGHGRNIVLRSIRHEGDLDNLIVFRRGRALGDDAGPDGVPRNVFGWDADRISHVGRLLEYVVRIDPDPRFRIEPTGLQGRFTNIVVDSVGLGLVDPAMAEFDDLLLDISERGSGKRVIGSASAIVGAGNRFSEFPPGLTDLRLH